MTCCLKTWKLPIFKQQAKLSLKLGIWIVLFVYKWAFSYFEGFRFLFYFKKNFSLCLKNRSTETILFKSFAPSILPERKNLQ